jgi:hypothetical protein
MLVEPTVKVDGVKPDQSTDPHDRDAVLMYQAPDVPHAGVELLGDGTDVEQTTPLPGGGDATDWVFWSTCRCHR